MSLLLLSQPLKYFRRHTIIIYQKDKSFNFNVLRKKDLSIIDAIFFKQKNAIIVMHGLVSFLDASHYKTVEDIWSELETNFGLTGIKVTPYPHFSWQVAEDYEWDVIAEKMKEISENTTPFIVRTAGLGIFSGESPIIFIAVVKDLNLIKHHTDIFNTVEPVAKGIVPYYHPNVWVPHISLAYSDVIENNIGVIMRFLSFRHFNWEIEIDNLALIYEPTGSIGQLKYKFKFSG